MTDYILHSDQDLLLLAAGGDSLAEETLLSRYSRTVRACARPLFLMGGDSEDLIQEGMMGLLSAIRQFDTASNVPFKSYAELCINRRLFSAVKSASRLKHLPLNSGIPLDDILSEESMPQAAGHPESGRRTTEEQVLDKESEEELLLAFSRYLSDFENRVLKLFLSGQSYTEMSQETGKSEKSIDNAVQRIRRKLSRQLPNLGEFSES
jgi:RNA polymerase sporulation-specific sigma factor